MMLNMILWLNMMFSKFTAPGEEEVLVMGYGQTVLGSSIRKIAQSKLLVFKGKMELSSVYGMIGPGRGTEIAAAYVTISFAPAIPGKPDTSLLNSAAAIAILQFHSTIVVAILRETIGNVATLLRVNEYLFPYPEEILAAVHLPRG